MTEPAPGLIFSPTYQYWGYLSITKEGQKGEGFNDSRKYPGKGEIGNERETMRND